MRKAAAKTTELDDVEQKLVALNAKYQFLAATTNMGFRLAVTVVIPIVAGVKLDEHFHSAPSLTLAGIFIAAGAGSAAVWSTIKEVNRQQAEADTETKTRRAKKRV